MPIAQNVSLFVIVAAAAVAITIANARSWYAYNHFM